MSSDSIHKIARLRQFLVAEGWVVSDVIRAQQGLELLTHPDHDRRQLSLPIDERYDDWEEACDRALEKVAQMTDRDARQLADAVYSPRRAEPQGRTRTKDIVVAVAVAVAAFYGGLRYADAIHRGEPIPMSLLGCMDRNAARAVGMMSHDAYARFSDVSKGMNNFLWTRQRALQAATYAEEMRRCYLEAQMAVEGFDANRLISRDMDMIDAAVTTIYGDIGASLIPGADVSRKGSMAKTDASFRNAENAANRISSRLGTIVAEAYF
jgi:hypothetical protein|nr:hypothetical protein [Neorhizobium tomejilense]